MYSISCESDFLKYAAQDIILDVLFSYIPSKQVKPAQRVLYHYFDTSAVSPIKQTAFCTTGFHYYIPLYCVLTERLVVFHEGSAAFNREAHWRYPKEKTPWNSLNSIILCADSRYRGGKTTTNYYLFYRCIQNSFH